MEIIHNKVAVILAVIGVDNSLPLFTEGENFIIIRLSRIHWGDSMAKYEIIKDNEIIYKVKDIEAVVLGIKLLLIGNTESDTKIEIHKTSVW